MYRDHACFLLPQDENGRRPTMLFGAADHQTWVLASVKRKPGNVCVEGSIAIVTLLLPRTVLGDRHGSFLMGLGRVQKSGADFNANAIISFRPPYKGILDFNAPSSKPKKKQRPYCD
jgi:hypothetical protein